MEETTPLMKPPKTLSLAERRGSPLIHLQHVGVTSSLPNNTIVSINHLQCDTHHHHQMNNKDRNVILSPRVRLSSHSLEDLKTKGIQQLSNNVRMDKHTEDKDNSLWCRENNRISNCERLTDSRGGLKPEMSMRILPLNPAVQLRTVDHPITPTRVNPAAGSLVPGHVPRIRRCSGSGRLMVLSDSGPKILQALVQNQKIVPSKAQERLARLRVPSLPIVIHETIPLDLNTPDRTNFSDISLFGISRPLRAASIESSFSSMNFRAKELPLKQPIISATSRPVLSIEEPSTIQNNVVLLNEHKESMFGHVGTLDDHTVLEGRVKYVDPGSLSWSTRLFRHAVSSNIDYCYHLVDVNSYQVIDSVIYENGPLLASASDANTSSVWKHLLAGGLAGAVSRTATAPLDRVKVMRMVLGTRVSNVGLPKMIRCMLKEGGAQSLWRGNAMNVVKVVPETALKFAIYEQIKNSIRSGRTQELGVKERFIAGSMAGFLSQTIIYPLEVLKTQMVLRRTGQYSGAVDCMRQMFSSNGIGSFYRGYLPNVLGIIPYAGIDLAIYETLKRWYISKQSVVDTQPGALVLLACALTSSTCGQLASYPLSLVRTRLQAQATLEGACPAGMVAEFRCIYKSDGLTGMYRGLAANFLKVAPAVGISYIVYENVRSSLGIKMT